MKEKLPWQTAWVTGASSGIGREIAVQLAARGVKVAASSRDSEKLGKLGGGIKSYPLDITDFEGVKETVRRIEHDMGPVDLVVLSAGVYTPQDINNFDPAVFKKTILTNYMGVVNCVASVLPVLMPRRKGHVAWIASVAGYRGLPQAAAYGPSKAALINLAESLKPDFDEHGLTLSVVNPGFVETPATSVNDFEMPFLLQPGDAAKRTIEGLAAGRFEVAYPKRFVAILKLARILPYRLYFWLIVKSGIKKNGVQAT